MAAAMTPVRGSLKKGAAKATSVETPMTGTPRASPIARPMAKPTRMPVKEPGPVATAIRSSETSPPSTARDASSTIGASASACPRAITRLVTVKGSTTSLSTIATEAAPQEVSIAKMRMALSNSLSGDESPGAVVGQELDQHRMRDFAIENDDALDAPLDRIDASLNFRNHAACDRAVGDQAADVADPQFLDQILVLVEDARNVGQEQEALGAERARDRAGERVGIDVVGLPIGALRDRRQHRDQFAPENLFKHSHI